MINALWITLIGMGLVFLAILLLWGLMALIVRLTADRTPAAASAPVELSNSIAPGDADADPVAFKAGNPGIELKRRAAAAAVAIALQMQKDASRAASQPPAAARVSTNGVSGWQAVNRSRDLHQRAQSFRKQVNR